MKVNELNNEEYLELCQRYITEFWVDNENGTTSPSQSDLMFADELVDRLVIEDYYAGVEFRKNDFFCNQKVENDKVNNNNDEIKMPEI